MLPKARRVVKDRSFSEIYRKGKRRTTENLNLVFMKTNQNISRFGFVVSKKQAHRIVDRNKIKRKLRSLISKLSPQIKDSFDVVIGGKKAVLGLSSVELEQEVVKLFKKAELL